MPWDYEETVRIDAEDILDYVKDNKDWFLDKLGEDDFVYKKKMQELSRVIHNMCNDEFDFFLLFSAKFFEIFSIVPGPELFSVTDVFMVHCELCCLL